MSVSDWFELGLVLTLSHVHFLFPIFVRTNDEPELARKLIPRWDEGKRMLSFSSRLLFSSIALPDKSYLLR